MNRIELSNFKEKNGTRIEYNGMIEFIFSRTSKVNGNMCIQNLRILRTYISSRLIFI